MKVISVGLQIHQRSSGKFRGCQNRPELSRRLGYINKLIIQRMMVVFPDRMTNSNVHQGLSSTGVANCGRRESEEMKKHLMFSTISREDVFDVNLDLTGR